MAIDKLGVYNDALTIIGERRLSSLTEDRPPRYRLDAIFDFGAIEICLELVKPRFACLTAELPSVATPNTNGFLHEFNLPNDYVAMAGVFANDALSEPVARYIVERRFLHADIAPLHIRYVSKDIAAGVDYTIWPPSFAKVVSSYMAKELASRSRPDLIKATAEIFAEASKLAIDLNGIEETMPRALPPTSTLTEEIRQIYNDALFLLGQPHLQSVTDTSENRAYLDAAMDQNVIKSLLEDKDWYFAKTSEKAFYNPSLEPVWGYSYGFDKPANLSRLTGLFRDEYLNKPLKEYADEGSTLFTNLTEIYLEYIPTTMSSTPALWPGYFRRLVAAELARKICLMIKGADKQVIGQEFKERQAAAYSDDAMQNPPRKIADGTWTTARLRGDSYRQRP